MGAIWAFFQRMPTRTVTLAFSALPILRQAQEEGLGVDVVEQHAETSKAPLPFNAAESFTITPGVVQTITLEFSGAQRSTAFYVPTTYTGTQAPLLFVLHGAGQDASAFFEPSKGITLWAETKNFIAVFPNGLPRPNAPPTSTNYYWSPNQDDVNIAYINFLMDTFMNQLAIDRRCVYVTGFSNGATFAYRLAADRATSARIAAIATVAGTIGVRTTRPITTPWTFADPALSEAWPVPALMLQGGLDPTHTTDGGFDADHDSINQSFMAKVDAWRAHLGAMSDGVSVNPPYAPGYVTATLYLSPTSGLGVLSILDPQLGHAWPKVNDWNFIGAIWEFFERMPKRTWQPPYNVYAPVVAR
jgi:poly(3-hydroxybutyrate) depolymerase